jgi:hypothetical protein
MLKSGKFEKVGDKLIYTEVYEHQLVDTGCVYLMRKAKDKSDTHIVYKLQKINIDPRYEPIFMWYGLWNTCATTEHGFPSIQEAIQAMLDKGHSVVRATFDDFCRVDRLFT